jgi:hypothetical protein
MFRWAHHPLRPLVQLLRTISILLRNSGRFIHRHSPQDNVCLWPPEHIRMEGLFDLIDKKFTTFDFVGNGNFREIKKTICTEAVGAQGG